MDLCVRAFAWNVYKYSDYIPIVSSVKGLTEIFVRYVIMPFLSDDRINSNRYFSYLNNQRNWSDSFVILIPIIGNIAACFFSSKNSNWDNQDFVMEKVLKDGLNLAHASPRLKRNRDIVFAATKHKMSRLLNLPPKLLESN